MSLNVSFGRLKSRLKSRRSGAGVGFDVDAEAPEVVVATRRAVEPEAAKLRVSPTVRSFGAGVRLTS